MAPNNPLVLRAGLPRMTAVQVKDLTKDKLKQVMNIHEVQLQEFFGFINKELRREAPCPLTKYWMLDNSYPTQTYELVAPLRDRDILRSSTSTGYRPPLPRVRVMISKSV